jgi:asparagine synthetase B (glutamine-hydrolysing)
MAVVEAYRASRLPGLSQLRGDYSYALWDGSSGALLAGCDAIGLRAPAFFSQDEVFLLSSSAVILLQHPSVASAWQDTYFAHVLSGLWSQPTTQTAFRDVRRMVGGQGLRASGARLEAFEGDRLRFAESAEGDVRHTVEALGAALDRAIVDDRSCLALSGGIDSCVVATALLRRSPEQRAFSLVAPEQSSGRAPALGLVLKALPGLVEHPVPVPSPDAFDSTDAFPLADDPLRAAPVLQPGRVALLRAVRDAGFAQLYDGEGGDELFDIAWRPGDMLRDRALIPLIAGLAVSGSRRTFLRDLAWMAGRPLSNVLLDRTVRRLRARRPWLRSSFWSADPFREALQEAVSFVHAPTARHRLPEVLGAFGRYWRVQERARLSVGVEGRSPLLSREVVELVGSTRPRAAIDLRHRKVLLRRLAAERVPAHVAWAPKREPLADWLVAQWIAREKNVSRAIAHIKSSPLLDAAVDARAFAASAEEAARRPGALASAVVEFAALAEWTTAIERRSLTA